MEKKSLLHFGLVLFLGQVLSSCSSAEYYRFAPAQQEIYKTLKTKPAPVAEASISTPEITPATNQTAIVIPQAEPVLETSARPSVSIIRTMPVAVKTIVPARSLVPNKLELTPEEANALDLAQSRLANLTKAEKKEFKNEVKDVLKENASDTNIVEIVLAILLPPVGVFLHEGITNRFWISLLLTILFFIPGMIYALLVVTDTI